MKKMLTLLIAIFLIASFFALSQEASPDEIYAQALSLVGVNDQDALSLFEKAAEGGHVASQTEAGRMYLNGTGVEKDLSKAYRFLSEAALSGFSEAQYLMGLLMMVNLWRHVHCS